MDGSLRLRDEVTIEAWSEGDVVILSPEPIKPDDRVTLEIPGESPRRLNARVSQSKPEITVDGAIRHRVRLSIESNGVEPVRIGGRES